MDEYNQEKILKKVREALGVTKSEHRKLNDILSSHEKEPGAVLEQIRNRSRTDREKMLELLAVEASALNLNVLFMKNYKKAADEIARVAEEKDTEWGEAKQIVAWRHPLIERLNLEHVIESKDLSIPIVYTGRAESGESEIEHVEKTIHKVNGSFIGITTADYCLAETATVVMKTRNKEARSVSLLPLIHVCVIELQRVIMNLMELYALLQHDPEERAEGLSNCMTFITGPSKTADIEGVMIHGAHGPREMYILVITG